MGAIEITINGLVADINAKTSIRLNRVFIDPTQFNLKDAVYTFSVTLPLTARNSAIFNRADIEEAQGKFTQNVAQINANGLQIFDGLCRVTSIQGEISCNFYRPAVKELADVFADKYLNENPPLWLEFGAFPTSVSEYNELAKTTPQKAVFPFIFWGVIPKISTQYGVEIYTAPNLWDYTARLGLQDVPPAFNLTEILKHIFESNGLNLKGNALTNKVLSKLYFSYKNPVQYEQPWNFGELGKLQIKGFWSASQNMRTGSTGQYEQGVIKGTDNDADIYVTDLLNATNTKLEVLEDKGGNVLYNEHEDESGRDWISSQIVAPTAGLYKIEFNASIRLNDEILQHDDAGTGVKWLGGASIDEDLTDNSFGNNLYEIHLVRDRKTADNGASSARLDGTFYRENQPQNSVFDAENIPKLYPYVDVSDGQVNLVDLSQDNKLIGGFAFGHRYDVDTYDNPKDLAKKYTQVLSAKPAVSWDLRENSGYSNLLAINSPAWWRYGKRGDFDTGATPAEIIDWSDYVLTGKALDKFGQPIDPATSGDPLGERIYEYNLNASTGGIEGDTAFNVTGLIDLTVYMDILFSGTATPSTSGALYAFYDEAFFFLGAFAVSTTTTYTDEPLPPFAGAKFVRFAEFASSPLTITGSTDLPNYKILNKLPIDKWFTYTIELPAGFDTPLGLFLHDGSKYEPIREYAFADGKVVITTDFAFKVVEPFITMYLETPDFDIYDGLVITREIDLASADVIDWTRTANRYKIDLDNAPANFARRGQFAGVSGSTAWEAEGKYSAVVWLEKGEGVSVLSVSNQGILKQNEFHNIYGAVIHDIEFDLKMSPFRTEKTWLKVDGRGNGTGVMDWNDAVNFETSQIDLVKFLASNVKTNDFVTNVCKAFNLRLTSDDGVNYRLDTKYSKLIRSGSPVNLNNTAGLKRRKNEPLNLPSAYKVNFAINENEEGFVRTEVSGNGQVNTGGTSDAITQSSFFSYAWYKELQQGVNVAQVPIISLAEFWDNSKPYKEAMLAKGYDLGMRFFFFADTLDEDGISFEFAGEEIKLARMANVSGIAVIDYGKTQDSLLRYFFYTDLREKGHYTYIYARLEPAQYKELSASCSIGFNGDVYGLAGVTGYDPTGKNETELKLIKQ